MKRVALGVVAGRFGSLSVGCRHSTDTSGGHDASQPQGTRGLLDAIQGDMVSAVEKGELNKRAPKLDGEAYSGTWDEMKEAISSSAPAPVTDTASLVGRATARGTELFFKQRGIDTEKPWVRELPGMGGVLVSAVSFSVKRIHGVEGAKGESLNSAEKAAINFYDVQSADSESMSAFSEMLVNWASSGRPRSGMVVMLRVGFILFRPWVNINVVAPDLSQVPTSRDFGKFGPDVTVPLMPSLHRVSLRSGNREGRVGNEGLGESMDRKFRHFLPDMPSLDIEKISDAALVKLSGIQRLNGKLGQYWTADAGVHEKAVNEFCQGTQLNFVDIVMIDAIHTVHGVVQSDEDIFDHLKDTFTGMEKMVIRQKIGGYGVDSNKLWGGASKTKYYMDPRLILRAAQAAAESVGSAKHHLKLVSLPFNLTERDALLTGISDDGTPEGKKTIFQFCKDQGIGCITTRPLATYDAEGKEERYVEFARVSDMQLFTKQLPMIIQQLLQLELQGERLLQGTVLRPSPELYHTGRSFIQASEHMKNYYQFDEFIASRYRGMLMACLKQITDQKDELLEAWASKYRKANEDFFSIYRQYLQYLHAIRVEKVRGAIDESLGGHFIGHDLSQVALNAVLSTNLMTSVTVGLRRDIYIDFLITRNTEILKPLPVSVMGGLFTNPETSFILRRPDKKLSPTGERPAEFAGKSEAEIQEMARQKYQKTGFSGEIIVGEENLPSFVKVEGED